MAEEIEATPSTRKTKNTTPGVVYMSRLPPFMKPAKIRNIFSQYGVVGRLFLQPEGKNCIIILSLSLQLRCIGMYVVSLQHCYFKIKELLIYNLRVASRYFFCKMDGF